MLSEATMQTAPDHSPNEAVHAEGGAHININRWSAAPRSAWELIVATALAVSIAVNVLCFLRLRDIDTRRWLHDYDLNQFETGPFADLKTQVLVNQKLITAFGPQQCKR